MGISRKSLREVRQVANHHSAQGNFPCRTSFDTFNDDCYHFTVDHPGPPTRIGFGNVASVQQRSSSETGTKMWTSPISRKFFVFLVAGTVLNAITYTSGAANEELVAVGLADDRIQMKVPVTWVRKQPRVKIIELEFSIPKVEDDQRDGRLTVMAAGGSLQQNVNRWLGQFRDARPKKGADGDVAQRLKAGGNTIHLVDISGTYQDRRGPFAPATLREGYRMLGAIIETAKLGQTFYFCKFYGPQATVAANEKRFMKMLESLEITE